MKKCETCNGSGAAVYSCCTGQVVTDDIQICPVCKEHLGEETCEDCNGTGEVSDDYQDFMENAPSLQAKAEMFAESRKYGE